MSRVFVRAAFASALAMTCLVSAELTARVEDWIRTGVPLLAVPDHDRDLIVRDERGIRGRPNGRFKKWRLNQHGFRGEDVALKPSLSCARVLVLGASETFGMYESPRQEYPAQLATRLEPAGCFEVINGAVVGLSVPAVTQLWRNWASRFEPDVVVMYPTPAFYLADNAPHTPRHVAPPSPLAPRWASRLVDRARDQFSFPDFIQRHRVERWRREELARARAGRHESWLFETVPPDRLWQFVADVESLVAAVEASGAKAVVVTHANAFNRPVRPEEIDALNALNVFAPRAHRDVLLPFEDATAVALRALAVRRGFPLVDAAARMNGRHDWFAEDFIHFNDAGAREIARFIGDEIVRGSLWVSAMARRAARGQIARTDHAVQ